MLEGIGLIEKRNKNCIKWKGAVAGENTQEASDRLSVLQDEISRLDQHEKMLDQHKTVSFSFTIFSESFTCCVSVGPTKY